MQIIDPFYLFSVIVIVAGISLLLYMKIALEDIDTFNLAIVGSKIQSFLLAYEISKLQIPKLNITLVGKFQPDLMKIIEAELNNQMPNAASLNSEYIDRKLIEFCGDEPLLRQLIQDTHLQFKIKRSQILFNKGSATQSEEQFASETYSIDQQKVTINSIIKYGLSHVTAVSLFDRMKKHLQDGIQQNMNADSLRGILNKIKYPHQPLANGLQYLSQVIGLDQKYIRDYVNPVISSNYFHNINSIGTLFKLMPLYCKTQTHDGRTKNLVLHLNQKLIAAKIVFALKDNKNLAIKSTKLHQFKQTKQEVVLDVESSSREVQTLKSDLMVILEDFQFQNQKQISFFKTIVDGLVARDEKLEQVYTIHFQNTGAVLSISRLCANECKNFKNSAYLVISRVKLQEKDLTMFTQHEILTYRKCWGARSQLPSSVIKFQQTPRIYRIADTELISDSYELKLIVFKNIANEIKNKVNARSKTKKQNRATKQEQSGDST